MNMIPYLFLICLIPTCFGARPTSIRLGQGCTLLKNTIYCYGGGKYASGSTAGAIDSDDHFTTFAEHYALDLTSGVDQVSADAWRNISTPPNGFVLEPNADFALIPVPQSNSYIVHGGLGYNNGNTALRNRTVMFHADTETWETIATPPTVELISKLTGVLDGNGSAWIWGGQTDDVMDSEDIPEPENVKILNIQSRAWQPLRVAFPSGQSARLGHAGALSSDGKIIYYFGGVYAQTESREYISNDFAEAPMTQVLKFDTTTRNWSIIESTNGDAPTPRSFHTAISVPNTNDILLYGGRKYGTNLPVDDYFYKYNTATNTYTRIDLPTGGAGPRWGHSAVLHQNKYLFVLFGANSQGSPTDGFYTISLDNNQWVGNPANGDTPASNGGNGGGDSGSSSPGSSLNGGAIAGVIVACLILAALILVLFLMYKRRRMQPQRGGAAGVGGLGAYQDLKTSKANGKDELYVAAENYEPARDEAMFVAAAPPPPPPDHAYAMSDSTGVLKPDVYYQKPNQL